MKQGKWFLSKTLVLFCLQQSKSKPAMAFREYLIELETQADKTHSKRLQDQRAEGTATREASLEQWPEWKKWNLSKGVSPITTTSEVLTGVLGASKKRYMAKRGIREPFRSNVEEGVLRAIVTGQAITMQIGSSVGASDTAEVNAVARRSGLLAKRLGAVTSLDEMDELYRELDRKLPK